MKAKVLTGTKREIADSILRFPGEIHEVIVVANEPAILEPAPWGDEDIFAEMEPFMAQAGDADDSREAIYTRLEGE